MKQLVCPVCKKKFKRTSNNQKYCCPECKKKYYKEKYYKKYHKNNYIKKVHYCKLCGTYYDRELQELMGEEVGGYKFCSKECRRLYRYGKRKIIQRTKRGRKAHNKSQSKYYKRKQKEKAEKSNL